MSLIDLLFQDKIWIDGTGLTVLLKDMRPSHRRNLIPFLERHAPRIKTAYEWSLAFGPQPEADMASLAFEQECARLWELDPLDWMNETPLMIELRRREDKFNSPRALKKRQRQRDEQAAAARALSAIGRDREARTIINQQNGWERDSAAERHARERHSVWDDGFKEANEK